MQTHAYIRMNAFRKKEAHTLTGSVAEKVVQNLHDHLSTHTHTHTDYSLLVHEWAS